MTKINCRFFRQTQFLWNWSHSKSKETTSNNWNLHVLVTDCIKVQFLKFVNHFVKWELSFSLKQNSASHSETKISQTKRRFPWTILIWKIFRVFGLPWNEFDFDLWRSTWFSFRKKNSRRKQTMKKILALSINPECKTSAYQGKMTTEENWRTEAKYRTETVCAFKSVRRV